MSQANRDNDQPPSPADQVRQLYEQAETQTARAMEQLVNRDSFGEMVAKVTENVVAVTKISNDALDLVVRNLRLAGRSDLTRLGRQLARNEDKLESVLQEVERLGDQMRSAENERAAASDADSKADRTTPRALEPTTGGGKAGGNRKGADAKSKSSS